MSKIQYSEFERKYITQIGKRIAELRHESGYTQEELAELMKISARALSDIENGKSCPNSIMIYRVADALHMSVKEFYDFL
ncbi:MAG: helix-turn-helix domain-containing protein [Anaeroplasmataceae bacterium]|nr:helix-turn-helix domain-containing protein [Anaeroplasmataceae bacterium]